MFIAQSASDECSLAGIVTTCIVEEAQKVSQLDNKIRVVLWGTSVHNNFTDLKAVLTHTS